MNSVDNEEFEKNIRKICLFAMFFKREFPSPKNRFTTTLPYVMCSTSSYLP